MCGIIAKSFTNPAPAKQVYQDIKRLYNKQRTRGTEGFGYVAIAPDMTVHVKRGTNEQEILPTLLELKKQTTCIMFHHRYPTSTENIEPCSHPIYVTNKELQYDYYVIHNGVITNHASLKTKHENLGYKYTTEYNKVIKSKVEYQFINWNQPEPCEYELDTDTTITKYNDSECIAIECVRLIENLQDNISTVQGGYSCIIMQVDKKSGKSTGNMYTIRNGSNPLCYTEEGDYCGVSEGEKGSEVSKVGVLYCYNIKTTELSETIITAPEPYKHPTTYHKPYTGYTQPTHIPNEAELYDEYDELCASLQFERDPVKRKLTESQLKAIERKLF